MTDIHSPFKERVPKGVRAGLPPGPLSLTASFRSLTDQSFYARTAARHGPVFKVLQFHKKVVCVTDLQLARDLLDNHASSLREPSQPFGRRTPAHTVAFLTDRNHPRWRAILDAVLTARSAATFERGVSESIHEELEKAVTRSRGGDFDPRPAIQDLTRAVLYRALFGLRHDDPRLESLRHAFSAIPSHRPELHVDRATPLIDIIRSSGREMVEGSPSADPASVLGCILREDPNHLQDTTLLGNLALVVLVTQNNVRLTILWLLKELLDHPEVMQDLHDASPESRAGLARNVVRETLRRHVSEFAYFEAANDIPVDRYRIPAGWLLRVCVREGHDDPSVFPEPQAFRPSRFAQREFSREEYWPNSAGTNSAFGAELAFMIATGFASVLAAGWQGHATRDGPAERSGYRHWKHWEPSPRLRVRLTPRTPVT